MRTNSESLISLRSSPAATPVLGQIPLFLLSAVTAQVVIEKRPEQNAGFIQPRQARPRIRGKTAAFEFLRDPHPPGPGHFQLDFELSFHPRRKSGAVVKKGL